MSFLLRRNTWTLENIVFMILIIALYVFNFQTDSDGNDLVNMIILVFMCLEFVIAFRRGSLVINKYIISFGLFVILAFISCIYSVSSSHTFSRSITILMNLVMFTAIIQYLSSRERIEFLLHCLVLGGLLASIYSIINSSFLEGTRTTDVIGNANTVAIYLCYTALISFYFLEQKTDKIFHIISYFVIAFAILITGSRTGLILLVLGTLIIFLLSNNLKDKFFYLRMLKRIIIIAVILYGIYFLIFNNSFLYSILGERVQSLIEILTTGESSINENSTFERIEMAQLAFNVFLEHPLLGCGMNGIGYYIKIYITGYYTFCHNTYLEILGGLGIIGFCLYYFMHISLIGEFNKIKKMQGKLPKICFLCLLLLIEILLSHFFIVHYYYKFEYVYLALIIQTVRFYGGKNSFRTLKK